MNALGRALAAHRASCTSPVPCTRQHACATYLQIARDHTAARQLYAGSTAPHVILSVRENPEVPA